MPALDFVFYGERPALDFANTLRRRRDPHSPTEDLLTQAGISNWFNTAHTRAAWATDLPLSTPADSECPEILDDALDLRNLIITLAEQAAAPKTSTPHPPLVGSSKFAAPVDLNPFASRAPLVFSADESGSLLPTATPEAIISIVAQDALRLFTSPARNRIKMCSHERCSILFEDRSNGLRRQWCSMKECGNRVKAARHAGTYPATRSN